MMQGKASKVKRSNLFWLKYKKKIKKELSLALCLRAAPFILFVVSFIESNLLNEVEELFLEF